MSKLKRFISIIFIIMFVFSIVANCSEENEENKGSKFQSLFLNKELRNFDALKFAITNGAGYKTPFVVSSFNFLTLFGPVPLFSNGSLKSVLLRMASDLTTPACRVHEFFRRVHLGMDEPLGKVPLFVGMVGHARQALVATLPGIALRSFAANLHEEPFLYFHDQTASSKILPEESKFTLLSWNVCFIGAGYPMSDGGVLPWQERIDRVVDKILEKNADVNCLYETFDTESAFYIYERLKGNGYSHFYFAIGAQAIGTSSGIMVASKYEVRNPEFTPFSDEMLVGRAKFANKGVFAFDLYSGEKEFAKVFATHLQHSEEPEFPTEEEVAARKMQMEMILQRVAMEKNAIVTGDLNLDDNEYESSSWSSFFEKGPAFKNGGKTWGGDEFCARLMGKRTSQALNLDHTMLLKSSSYSIETSLVETGFDGALFQKDALSDHAGLFSEIHVFS